MEETVAMEPEATQPLSALANFTIAFCGSSLAYTVLVLLWRLATYDSILESNIFKLILAGMGLFQVAWSLGKYEDLMSTSDLYFGIISTIAAASALRTYMSFVRGPPPRIVDMRGKVVIITGSNTGIGYETAKAIVSNGAHVIMACRSEEKAKAAIERMTKELELVVAAIRNSNEPAVRGNLEFMQIDMSSMASVRAFVEKFKASKLSLDVLILNAGVMMNNRTTTDDGFETTLAVNLLSNFLLTTLLLPKLKASEDGRVVCVSSALHFWAKKFNMEDPMHEKGYSLSKAYANSKLGLLMFQEELQQRLFAEKSSVIVNSVSPGTVMTEISRNMNLFMRTGNALFRPVLALFCKQPYAGAYGVVYTASTKLLRSGIDGKGKPIGGLYLVDSAPQTFNKAASVDVSCKEVWKLCEDLVKQASKKAK